MELPVLLYHHVVTSAEHSDLRPFIVEENDFVWQLDMMEDLGYTPLTLRELLVDPDTSRKVVITFDDCPRNLLDHALPHLERKNWKAVFFAPVAHLGGCNAWNVAKGKTRMELMTEDELRSLNSLGHEIGAHSMTHPHLDVCSPEVVAYEIEESKRQLDRSLGTPVTSFAYPYGGIPANYRAILQQAGYRCAVAMESDAPTIASNPYRIGRCTVETGETPVTFKYKLTGVIS